MVSAVDPRRPHRQHTPPPQSNSTGRSAGARRCSLGTTSVTSTRSRIARIRSSVSSDSGDLYKVGGRVDSSNARTPASRVGALPLIRSVRRSESDHGFYRAAGPYIVGRHLGGIQVEVGERRECSATDGRRVDKFPRADDETNRKAEAEDGSNARALGIPGAEGGTRRAMLHVDVRLQPVGTTCLGDARHGEIVARKTDMDAVESAVHQ